MTIATILLLILLTAWLALAYREAKLWYWRGGQFAILLSAALFVLIAGLALVGMAPA